EHFVRENQTRAYLKHLARRKGRGQSRERCERRVGDRLSVCRSVADNLAHSKHLAFIASADAQSLIRVKNRQRLYYVALSIISDITAIGARRGLQRQSITVEE